MPGKKKIPFVLYMMAGIFITAVSLYGYTLVRHRAGLPLEIREYAEKNLLVRINDIEIKTDQDIEFIFCRQRAGDWGSFYVKTNKGIDMLQAQLDDHYSFPFPHVYLLIGFFMISMAFVVFLRRPGELRPRLFFWASLLVSCTLIVNGGFYCLTKSWLSYIPGVLFYAFYPLIPTLVLHFSVTFLEPKKKVYDYLIYFPAIVNIIILEYFFLKTGMTSSIAVFRQYQSFATFFRGFFIFYFLLSFVVLLKSYRNAILAEHRAQIKWILYGLFFGVGPMIFMYQLPRVLIKHPLVSEELVPVFVIFIPIAFSISIFRFKLMNIELIINRSLVYSILTVFTVSIYLLFVQVIQGVFSKYFADQQTTISILGAFLVALVFDPARRRIQGFVDRAFFRVSYDYKRSILSFNERAHRMVHQDHLVDLLMRTIDETIPLDDLGLRVLSVETGNQKVMLEKGMGEDLVSFSSYAMKSGQVYARREGVQTEIGVDFSVEKSIEETKFEMLISLPFRTTSLVGILCMGKKKSRTRFSGEDIELLRTLAETFVLNLERVHLQEEVIYERAEKEKFDELNRLKTEFISTVSHEIRTPMSSIHSMSEILQQGKIKRKEKQEEILELMTDECGRLSRFLHNILDYGKIELNVKEFKFLNVDISRIVDDVLKIYAYQFQARGFSVTKRIPKDPVWFDVDPDALKQALTNLIDNAIKYSDEKREIHVVLVESGNRVEIRVQDKGIGIPEDEQEKIFSGFYRVADARQLAPKGVGIGLKIVKHVMDAHRGNVLIESRPGEGSVFILVFPK